MDGSKGELNINSRMKSNIIKYDNNFNLSNLNTLEKIEQDLFMTICSQFTQKRTQSIKLSLSDLKSKAKLMDRKYTDSKFIEFVKSVNEKILKIIFSAKNEKELIQMPLFKRFVTNFNENYLEVSLNDCFEHYLYDIPDQIGFSRFELEMFLNLKTKYAKTLFRFLLQNFTGYWSIDFQAYKDLMGFSKSYRVTTIIERTNKAIDEIKKIGIFTSITLDAEYSRSKGRPLKVITFRYTFNKRLKAELEGQTTIYDFLNSEDQEKSLVSIGDIASQVIVPAKEEVAISVEQKKDVSQLVQENIFGFNPPIYEEPVLISRKKDKEIPKAPKCTCGGGILYRKDKNGMWTSFCTNNAYYGLGTCNHNNGRPNEDSIKILNILEQQSPTTGIYTPDPEILTSKVLQIKEKIMKKFGNK